MRKCVFVTVTALLITVGCASKKEAVFTREELDNLALPQKDGLPKCSGGFVLAVCGETITSEEIIEPLVERFRQFAQRNDLQRFTQHIRPQIEQILTNKISNILLYEEAKKQAGKHIDEALEKAVKAEVSRFVVSFNGDYAKAEEELARMGMDWDSFREYQKKMILSQSYISSQIPEQKVITYSQLLDYYNKIKDQSYSIPAKLRFQLIDIEVAKLEITDPNKSRYQQAGELADELVRRLEAGTDFGELARKYSHGHRAMFGGLWKSVQPKSLAEPYDILARQAEKFESGQIAGPIAAGEHIFIMKLLGKNPKGFEPFEKIQQQIEAKITLECQKEAIDQLSSKLVQQADLAERGRFIDYCLEEIYRMSNQ